MLVYSPADLLRPAPIALQAALVTTSFPSRERIPNFATWHVVFRREANVPHSPAAHSHSHSFLLPCWPFDLRIEIKPRSACGARPMHCTFLNPTPRYSTSVASVETTFRETSAPLVRAEPKRICWCSGGDGGGGGGGCYRVGWTEIELVELDWYLIQVYLAWGFLRQQRQRSKKGRIPAAKSTIYDGTSDCCHLARNSRVSSFIASGKRISIDKMWSRHGKNILIEKFADTCDIHVTNFFSSWRERVTRKNNLTECQILRPNVEKRSEIS